MCNIDSPRGAAQVTPLPSSSVTSVSLTSTVAHSLWGMATTSGQCVCVRELGDCNNIGGQSVSVCELALQLNWVPQRPTEGPPPAGPKVPPSGQVSLNIRKNILLHETVSTFTFCKMSIEATIFIA